MSNLNPNRINFTYPQNDVDSMKANALLTISLIPDTAVMTDVERAAGGDIDVVNKVFVEDCLHELTSNGASIMPGWFNTTDLSNDLTFFEQSDEIISVYSNIVTRLKDAQRIAGREAYVAATKAYNLYKSAADAGVAGAQESYDRLKTRFERSANPVQPHP